MIENIRKSISAGFNDSYRPRGDLYTTERLTFDLLNLTIDDTYKASRSDYAYSSDFNYLPKINTTMSRVIKQMISRHTIIFDNMILKLDLMDTLTYEEIISQVWDMDKANNWGRVVSIFAFCSRISRHFKENNITNKGTAIWKVICDYIVRMISQWIHNNGGWVSYSITYWFL